MKHAVYFSLLALLLSCDKLSFPDDATLPIVEMLEVTEVDNTGATLKAYVHHLGTQRIVRSSFNWYPNGKTQFLEEERYLTEVALQESSEISTRITRDMVPGVGYEARVIIELEGEKIYSNTVEFTSRGATQQPIRMEDATESLYVISDVFALWGLDNIYMATDLGGTSRMNLHTYNVTQTRWTTVNESLNGLLFSSCFYADDQRIYFAGRIAYNSGEPSGLWYLDSPDGDFVRVGDFPVFRSQIRFSFALGDRFYTATQEGRLGYFELENYQGLIDLGPLPFSSNGNAHHYYSFEVGGKALVFFSEPQEVTYPPQYSNQFWMFDPTTATWTKRSDYPGAGKDFFVSSSDGERYLFLGLGAVGTDGSLTNRLASQGDIWRYDLLEDNWEFIGWSPINKPIMPSITPRIKDGKHHVVTGGIGSINVISISPDQISPL